ncbi:MAG TPA: hypothetical protein VNJ03_18280 [Vicinamibacterales bacterium]|nr:hypothetical protein [Vicinamibacterales bacterium]
MLYVALIVLAVNIDVPLSSQCQTIADRITARPAAYRAEPLEMHPTYELLTIPIQEVVAAGEVVVEGTVHPIRTYLSDDGCQVLTDYAVHVLQVAYGTLPPEAKPGLASPLTITTYGGQMTINGIKVVARLDQLPPFTPAQHLLLILSRKAADPRSYELAKGVYGAFSVENGRVKHLLQSAGSARFDDMDKTALIAKFKRK